MLTTKLLPLISKVRVKLINPPTWQKYLLVLQTFLPKTAEGKLKPCIYNEAYLEPI